jgi:hypothetical protein
VDELKDENHPRWSRRRGKPMKPIMKKGCLTEFPGFCGTASGEVNFLEGDGISPLRSELDTCRLITGQTAEYRL